MFKLCCVFVFMTAIAARNGDYDDYLDEVFTNPSKEEFDLVIPSSTTTIKAVELITTTVLPETLLPITTTALPEALANDVTDVENVIESKLIFYYIYFK